MSASCSSGQSGPSVDTHPCFSKDAHHKYARMHLAVAPACNIQCNYCNRKYDCANESRPGVVSELLTPQQAVEKVRAVKAKIPQLTVVGIAGPGDPLANPARTFETCERIAAEFPELQLCLSTNGLTLPQHVERIKALNVHHVTITINALDPEVGAKVYPWIFHNNRRIRGKKAAAILIRNQFKGLEMLVERGVLVKVNSVMIPGMNEDHLLEVNKVVSEKGAFLHNIMPLISAPEHGTYFGLMGQRNPEDGELEALRARCAGDVELMTHCRQCRADAVGMLGEDRNAEFTMDKIAPSAPFFAPAAKNIIPIQLSSSSVSERTPAANEEATHEPRRVKGAVTRRLAVTSKSGTHLDQHFGHAERFLVYDASPHGVTFVEERNAQQYCFGDDHCGDKESALSLALKTLTDCEAILCERIGFMPWQSLEQQGIQPINRFAGEAIENALMSYCAEQPEASASGVACVR
ncbi:nitrogenase cofactor biosynthesis protein NifB [Magnetococcus marinus MC-1]|uniref:FeMo cofactor biosynthesis protein NifB n=1 Tax=Magnetococcus marinus (strain ATCC BAA-1437 / JCM 17883 / MC-1) TaxID=156889 RepID=A0L6X4_MAGMM|nr:nitrogenase cofactor biosynthesis protein NifB [Magnetococcus marinus]ABK43717.1 nitrogenase cofactor biosynthesis protein NifB [Magnetococcus marinus MC-1]